MPFCLAQALPGWLASTNVVQALVHNLLPPLQLSIIRTLCREKLVAQTLPKPLKLVKILLGFFE